MQSAYFPPDAGIPPVRVCAGAVGNSRPYRELGPLFVHVLSELSDICVPIMHCGLYKAHIMTDRRRNEHRKLECADETPSGPTELSRNMME